MTLATYLTVLRIGLALILAPAILIAPAAVAASIVIIAAITDFADGRIARARGEVTPLGAALDPIADKLIIVAALVAFVAASDLTGAHLVPVFVILLRETLVAGLRESGAANTLPVSVLAKWKTATQFAALFVLCLGPSAPGLGLLWAAMFLTAWTGADYLRRWRPNG